MVIVLVLFSIAIAEHLRVVDSLYKENRFIWSYGFEDQERDTNICIASGEGVSVMESERQAGVCRREKAWRVTLLYNNLFS